MSPGNVFAMSGALPFAPKAANCTCVSFAMDCAASQPGVNLLKTPSRPAFLPAKDRGIYGVWIGLIWAGMLGGFVPDLKNFLSEAPPPPVVLHAHAIVSTLWLAAITAQIALVEVRNVALHRRLGWWIVGLSVALIPLGLIASLVDMARGAGQTPYTPEFLGHEFQQMAVFAILLVLATLLRRDPAAHKRLMILLPVSILDPGTGRLWTHFLSWRPHGPLGSWLHAYWGNMAMVAAMLLWDRWRHGRAHPALWFGAALITVGEVVAIWLDFCPAWHTAAARLVAAWGWTG